MFPYNQEIIVALATPPGLGALAVVRLSGPKLGPLYKKFTRKKPQDRLAAFSPLFHPETGVLLDEVIATYFKGPKSYTGEDMIEISCHGGDAVQNSIVQASIESGARQADPGEFSLRAFINGKMDLLQAEAISAIISSKSSLSTQISLNHLEGRVSALLKKIKQNILDTLSIIENELNFSEEEINFTSLNELKKQITVVIESVQEIIQASVFGKNIFSGIRVILFGKPNSGKSSLFNAILGYDRAIVSSTAGTTRDTVEAWFELGGVPVCLIDTAGVWESETYLDGLGVAKTLSELDRADICILVDDEDPAVLLNSKLTIKTLLVRTKSDLENTDNLEDSNIVNISSITGEGINKLLTRLSTYTRELSGVSGEHINQAMVSKRQRQLLSDSLVYLNDSVRQIDSGIGTDIIASTLRGFVVCLQDVVGEIPNKEVMKNIFSNFCVGK